MAVTSADPATASPESANAAAEAEALRLLALAESKIDASSPSSLESALKLARRARRLRPELPASQKLLAAIRVLLACPSDHYAVLRLPPLSPASSLRRQYKSLAHALRSDMAGSSDVPSSYAVEEAFKRVSASFRYLSDRRNKRLYDLRLATSRPATFWTACSTCRLLHEFNRKYIGYRLTCPSCCKSFLAVEVPSTTTGSNEAIDMGGDADVDLGAGVLAEMGDGLDSEMGSGVDAYMGTDANAMLTYIDREDKLPPSKKQKREKTLAEMQLEIKKAKAEKEKKGRDFSKLISLDDVEEIQVEECETEELGLMAVEDADFYNFDNDRTERSFQKGQIWAVYDDDDGMPRHYGLIEEVIKVKPFQLKMRWLDPHVITGNAIMQLDELRTNISCGQFKVAKEITVNSVNLFSHFVHYERAARELYRIYPKKGSVWALYAEGSGITEKEERKYDVVVTLTRYSDEFGLSVAYLEKVPGYKTIFKRRELGCHAVRWLQKDDLPMLSHQIPVRMVCNSENKMLPVNCWELDPASLSPGLLSITTKS